MRNHDERSLGLSSSAERRSHNRRACLECHAKPATAQSVFFVKDELFDKVKNPLGFPLGALLS